MAARWDGTSSTRQDPHSEAELFGVSCPSASSCSAVLEERVNGLLVPAGDAAATATALDELLGDADLRSQLGNAARSAVSLRFSRGVMVEGIVAVYREVLEPSAFRLDTG